MLLPGQGRIPVVVGWSGGKDSALALGELRASATYDVVGLFTTVTSEYDRVSIHGVRRALLHQQAAALGLPLWEATVKPNCSNADYEESLGECLERMRSEKPAVHTLAFGDLFLADIRAYRERLMARLGFEPVFPVWGRDTAALAREFIASGYAARLVCVDTQKLNAGFSGRAFDTGLLADFPEHVDPCGENGEFHTFVSWGPTFRRHVAYDVGEVVLRDERFAYCDLLPMADGG